MDPDPGPGGPKTCGSSGSGSVSGSGSQTLAENYLSPSCELSKLPYTERRKIRVIGSLPFWLCKLGSGGKKLRYIIFKERGDELFPRVFLCPWSRAHILACNIALRYI
jgi:hypothetical protein